MMVVDAYEVPAAMLIGLAVIGFWFDLAEKRIIAEIRKSRGNLPTPPSEE